jgi:hypothetical protein
MQIPHSPTGVLPADDDPLSTRKGQIVTDEDPRSGHETGREALVVTVPDPDDPGKVRDGSSGECDVQDPEVTLAVMGEAVR